jgi:hypothetical protein
MIAKARAASIFLCLSIQVFFAPLAVLAADDVQTQIDAQVTALGDENAAARDKAAARLRELIAKDANAGGHDESHWTKVLQSITIGMSRADVEKIIPRREEEQPTISQGMGCVSVKQRLDNNWEATLYFDANGNVYSPPKLKKSLLSIWVPPTPDFNGKWVTYFVNGQKATEIDYKDGEYHGTYTSFYPNGNKTYEQHYVNGVVQGTDQGWHENGKQSYTGQYVNDRQDGLWVWWNPDGTKQKEVLYKNGKPVSAGSN